MKYFVISKLKLFLILFSWGVSSLAGDESVSSLILSGGQNVLYSYDFDRSAVRKLFDIPSHGSYKVNYFNLSKVNEHVFLFESPMQWIGLFDLRVLQEKKIVQQASCPVFFESTNHFIYMKVVRTEGGFAERLYSRELDTEESEKLADLARGTASQCPIKLDADKAIVYLSHSQKEELALYNAVEKSLTPLRMKNCTPVLGLGENKILCLSNEGYFVSNLDGERLMDIPDSLLNVNNMFPIAYIESIRSIVVQEYRERLFRDTIVNLWSLDIEVLKKSIMVENLGVTKRGVVSGKL